MKIDNIKTIVFTTIDELNQNLIKEDQLEKSLETRLFGGNSNLDSLGLVNLIVAVEQNNHGIPVLKSKDELKNWYHSLNIEKAVSSNA